MYRSTNNVPLEDFPVSWFNQKLDHFNPEETRYILQNYQFKSDRTFKQRFYTNPQYYQVGGPIFLYINGEGPVFSPPNLPTDEVVLLAQVCNSDFCNLMKEIQCDDCDTRTPLLRPISTIQHLDNF